MKVIYKEHRYEAINNNGRIELKLLDGGKVVEDIPPQIVNQEFMEAYGFTKVLADLESQEKIVEVSKILSESNNRVKILASLDAIDGLQGTIRLKYLIL